MINHRFEFCIKNIVTSDAANHKYLLRVPIRSPGWKDTPSQ